VCEVDLLGLVISTEYGQQCYLTTKRGLHVGEVDLLGLMASP
jgi:hypothetical protein